MMAKKPSNIAATKAADPQATVNKADADTADTETADPQATVNKADEVIRVRTVDGGGDYYRGGIKFTQNWQELNINDIANPNDWQRIKTDPLLEIQKGDGS